MKALSFKLIVLALLLLSVTGFSQKEKPLAEVETAELGEVEDDFQEHFFEALKLKAIENHEKAITELISCLAIDAHPVVYLELGKNFNALEQYQEAAAYLEKGRQIVPDNEAILETLYTSYFMDNEFDKALPVVKKLSDLDISFSEDLVHLYLLQERYDEALGLLDELDKKIGASTRRDSLRRQIYSQTRDVEAQIADLEERIETEPENEKNFLNLIFVYSENGNIDKAFEVAEKLLEMKPDSELVHLALYKFYLNQEDSPKAVNSLRIVLGSGQIDEVTKYQALNDFLMYVAEDASLEKDLIDLVQVFAARESNTKVYDQLGTFFMEKNEHVQALEYFRLALESGNQDMDLYRNILQIEQELGNFVEMITISDQALETFPSQPLLYLFKGRAQNRVEQFDAAEETLLLGQEYLFDNSDLELEYLRELSRTYTGLGKSEKAADLNRKVDELENKNN